MEKHPTVAIRQWNLDSVYISMTKRKEALELLESAYNIFLNSFGKDHPPTKRVKSWIDKYGKSYRN